jgi:hypothetical protein
MNKVLTSMLKGAAKNPLVFGLVISFVSNALADIVKRDGITEGERTLIGAVRGVHDTAHEFLAAVGEDVQ